MAPAGAPTLPSVPTPNLTRSLVAGARPLAMACLALAFVFRANPRLNPTPAALHFAFYSLGVGLVGIRSLLGGNWIVPVAGTLTALSYAALIRATQRFPRALTDADFRKPAGDPRPDSDAPAQNPLTALLAWLLSPWIVWPIGFLLGGLYLFVALPPVVGSLRLGMILLLAIAYLYRGFQVADGEGRRRLSWVAMGGLIYGVIAVTGLVVRAAAAEGSPDWWWWVVMTARYASLACFAKALLAPHERTRTLGTV